MKEIVLQPVSVYKHSLVDWENENLVNFKTTFQIRANRDGLNRKKLDFLNNYVMKIYNKKS